LTKALSLRGDKAIYRARAITYAALGEDAKATADLKEALALDPSDLVTLERLTTLQSQTGAAGDALAELDPALANGGANEPMLMAMKATVLANSGDADAAIEQINQAVEKRPGNAQLLNARCWLKATLNRDLAAAVEDCTRAIQMDDPVTAAALDSRALAYLRQNQPKAALADLDAALSLRPDAPGSLFLRALVERALGQPTKAAQDIAAARYLSPSIDKEYGRYGLRWAS
jgi:tetratricopeptide (TPR) repeat protein